MKESLPSPNSRKPRLSPYLYTLFAFIVFITFLYSQDFNYPFLNQHLAPRTDNPITEQKKKKEGSELPFAVEKRDCDVFSGRWVRDELIRPHYKESDCPYFQLYLTCQEHGRPDKGYHHWEWQPRACSLPSFNASFVLESLRGKRIVFVGNSLNRESRIAA